MKKIMSAIVTLGFTINTIGTIFAATPTMMVQEYYTAPSESISIGIDVSDLIEVKQEVFYDNHGTNAEVQINYVKEGSTITFTKNSNVYNAGGIGYIEPSAQAGAGERKYFFIDAGGAYKEDATFSFSIDGPRAIFDNEYYAPYIIDKDLPNGSEFVNSDILKNMGYQEGATVYFALGFEAADPEFKRYMYYFAVPIGSAALNTDTKKTDASDGLKQNKQAIPTPSKVFVNGRKTGFNSYNIENENFFQLRDLAYALNGSEKQFDITFDSERNVIQLHSNQAYKAIGKEMSKGDGRVQTPVETNSKVLLDGKEVLLTAYNINGNNYFKLRDIGQLLNIAVSWDATSNAIQIDSTKSYTE